LDGFPSLPIIPEENQVHPAARAILARIGEWAFAAIQKRQQAGDGRRHEQKCAPRRSI
jgi:hypothetical protein